MHYLYEHPQAQNPFPLQSYLKCVGFSDLNLFASKRKRPSAGGDRVLVHLG